MTPRRRLRIWEAHKGRCCICEQLIDGAREKWIVEHIRALELGGPDTDANCAPAHASCASEKTNGPTGDHARAAKAKRQKQRHIGIRESKSPMPCGKNSPFKRTMDGRVIRRDGK